jgi:hypothetical protein
MKLTKKILSSLICTLVFAQSTFSLPLDLGAELDSLLMYKNPEGLTAENIKSINKTRNADVHNAYENYFIAKRNVSIARATINPIHTGLVLGVYLGANYLWAPLAVNAVLSLPTMFYNASRNKALANAEYWYHLQAKEVLAVEATKLYYDILTNEFILDSIDLEISLYNELLESLTSSTDVNEVKVNEINGTLLGLQRERLNIHDVVIKERAALNTMLSFGPDVELDLAHNTNYLKEIKNDVLSSRDLEAEALRNSKEYNAKYWLYRASVKNVKMVKWSLISFNGLNFTYGQRVKVAKAEREVAQDEMELKRISVRKGALDALNQLRTSFELQKISETKSYDSLSFSAGVRTNYENGQLNLSDFVMTAVSAIRDYRNLVVAHYATLGKIEDFNLSMGQKADYSENGVLNLDNL